jgi:repressor of nif and glnA expression
MRRRFKWMNKASEPVLELLVESGLALNQKAILLNLQRQMDDPPGRRTISRCLEPLEEYGFVENVAKRGGYYVITDLGRAYLNDELSDSEIEQLRDSE